MGNNMCHKCCGVCSLIVGILILINMYLWPRWLGVDGWVTFFGVLAILGGLIKLLIPNKCPDCNVMMDKPMKKK
ncbi:hypothetical protein J4216_06225 [Candidatus Woesearchaeota archaeon]|nr:hypothetical protein [Candidatus Woesearchaeota archaeon]